MTRAIVLACVLVVAACQAPPTPDSPRPDASIRARQTEAAWSATAWAGDHAATATAQRVYRANVAAATRYAVTLPRGAPFALATQRAAAEAIGPGPLATYCATGARCDP